MTVSDGRSSTADATAEETVLPLEGGDVHVRQDGPRDAPVLLLIHGSAASTGSWDAMVPLLTGSHRVIRIDLLGHGRSAKPVDGDYGIPEQARRAGQALERLGAERAVVVGHSSGGYTAVALAERRPELVTGLVLINTGPRLDAFLARESGTIGPEQWPPSDDQLRKFASGAFRAGYEIPQDLVDELRGLSYHAFTAAMRASLAYVGQSPVPDRLAPLGIPLQVIFGDQDTRWRPASFGDYGALPGARVDALPGIGHTPILEDPAGTAGLLLRFAAQR
ncbi:alpha/beta fold hydrolase [Actinacidiphila paucisporea]|nr:alpha/beta fold hydrolase [Actinacidiphila paucisporea]